jgi:hypothetical protein
MPLMTTWSFASVPLWAGLLPAAAYLAALAAVHMRRRPLAVAGAWDLLLLAAATAGLAVVGPLALLQPAAGGTPWVVGTLVLGLGPLCAAVLLVSRPRMVVYNITPEQLRPVVAEVVAALDPTARWAGETAALPGRGLQVHLDGRGSMRSVSIVALGARTSAEGWAEFSRRLRQAIRRLRVRRSPWAALFGAAAAGLVIASAWLAGQPASPAAVPAPVTTPASGACHDPAGRSLAA